MNKSQSQNKSRRIASARIILNQSRNNNFASPTKNEQTFAEYSKNSGAEFVMRTLSKGTIYHDNQNKDFKSIKSMALHNIEKKTLFNDDEKQNDSKSNANKSSVKTLLNIKKNLKNISITKQNKDDLNNWIPKKK